MCVQGDEIPELTIYNPSCCTICIFALDTKDSLLLFSRMITVTDTDSQSMKKNWNSPASFLISLQIKPQHQRREATSDEFICDVDLGD